MLIYLLLIRHASAFPVDVAGLPLPEIGVGIDAVVLADGPHVVVVGASGANEIDPFLGGALFPYSSEAARAVLLRDAGSSHQLVTCGSTGLFVDDPLTDAMPAPLSTAPCSALLRRANGFVAVGGPAVAWVDAGNGLTSTNLGLDVLGEPIGAVDGDRVAVAAFGDDTVQIYDPAGSADVLIGAEIGGIAAVTGGWRLGLLDGRLYDLPGSWRMTGESLGALVSADLDGDGVLDTVAMYPYAGMLGVFGGDGAAEVRVPAPWGARSLAVADFDGDGCDEVFVLDPGAAQLFVVQDPTCGAPVDDLDGDGSVAPADCNDADPAVHPGAAELCDQLDQDCDGQIDELGVEIDAPESADEGTAPSLEAKLGGCSNPGVEFRWTATYTAMGDTGAPEVEAACTDLGPVLRCTGPDDGVLNVTVAVATSDGTVVGTDDAAIEVRNVPPRLVVPADWSQFGGVYGTYLWLQLETGTVFETVFGSEDVADDVVTFGVEGPWYVGVSSDGTFRVEAQPPYAYYGDPVVLTLSDEDGGVETWPIELGFYGGGYDTGGWYTDTGNDSGWDGWDWGGDGDSASSDISCGGCCCWLVGLALPVGFLPLRRRLRP